MFNLHFAKLMYGLFVGAYVKFLILHIASSLSKVAEFLLQIKVPL